MPARSRMTSPGLAARSASRMLAKGREEEPSFVSDTPGPLGPTNHLVLLMSSLSGHCSPCSMHGALWKEGARRGRDGGGGPGVGASPQPRREDGRRRVADGTYRLPVIFSGRTH